MTDKCQHCGGPARTDDTCCKACFEYRTHGIREKAARSMWAAVVAMDIQTDNLSCTFVNSNAAIEKANAASWSVVRSWNREQPLLLCGPPGAGKSYAARCVLNQELAKGHSIAEATGARIGTVSRHFGRDETIARWQSVDFMLVDDIDKAEFNEAYVLALWEIFDGRENKPTIITTNLKQKELRDNLHRGSGQNTTCADAIADRLSAAKVLPFTGKSWRGK